MGRRGGGPAAVAAVKLRDTAKVAWLSRTTLSVNEARATARALRARFPQLIDPPSGDICYAAQNRQDAVERIAAASDLVLVVGSANSHNSSRLAEIARNAGAPASRVDHAGQTQEGCLDAAETISVTASASAPAMLL